MEQKTINIIIILLLVMLSFSVFVGGNRISNKVDNLVINLTDKIEGIYNNEDFSKSIENISKSIYMIVKQPLDPQDGLTMGNIYTDSEGIEWSKGTGFAITNDGWLVTAKHVVDNSNAIIVLDFDANGVEHQYTIKSRGMDPVHDIALIKIDKETIPVKITTSNDLLPIGFKIGFIGFPSNEDQSAKIAHDGIISYAKFKGELGHQLPEYNVHAFVNGGQSGGPVFLADTGEVIGIISARAIASNLAPAKYIDPLSFEENDARRLLAEIYNRQSEMYNLLSKEVSEKTQMGVGVVVGFNKETLDRVISADNK
ncbi:MAG: trypsin-like peptidase domain-containing protein [Nanoarchaeota archaeon]|nr:trypsin-like peptidase domain-containing protein [Nanoarchaeota archaeon]